MIIDKAEDFLYYTNYRNQLIEYVLSCSSYERNEKRHGRERLNRKELFSLLKEIQLINKYLNYEI